jgi:hypothetical protein
MKGTMLEPLLSSSHIFSTRANGLDLYLDMLLANELNEHF